MAHHPQILERARCKFPNAQTRFAMAPRFRRGGRAGVRAGGKAAAQIPAGWCLLACIKHIRPNLEKCSLTSLVTLSPLPPFSFVAVEGHENT